MTHYSKKVDLSFIIRFSEYPNNALFELVPVKFRRVENDITVGLQLESGERLMHEFSPSTNLWDIICYWQKENRRLKNDNEIGEPICIYMRKELVGEEILRNTTLRNLGLTGGKAVIRFLYRQPEILREQAHVCIPLPKQLPPVQIDDRQNELIDNLNSATNVLSVQNTNSNVVSKTFSSVSQIEEDIIADQTTSKRLTDKSNEVMDVLTVTESDIPIENIIHVGERNAVLYNLEDILPLDLDDLPDEFYEVTIEDVKYMFNDLRRQRKELEEKPLETSVLRQRRQQLQLLSYQFSIIRIYFPNRIVLQGIFLPTETIADVMKFVQKFLNSENIDFYLYITPPRKILSPESVLVQEELVPAAILYFGSNTVANTDVLQEWCREKVSSPKAARYSAQLSRKKASSTQPGPSSSAT